MSRSGGELLVACLQAQGVTVGFGVPGESYLEVLDALVDSSIRYVSCRQEGGAAYAAEAYGKFTGTPGVCFVTRGPGATNASVGLHTAMQDSSPLVLFVGQAATGHLGREAFQEVDYRAFFGPLVKWATQIEDVDRIPEVVSRAFATAQNGRPGPVVVALPEDVLEASSDERPGSPVRLAASAPSEMAIAETVELIEQAVRPLLLVGGGGWTGAGRAALKAFAEGADLAVASAFRFHDLLDNDSKCYVGDAGVGMLPHVRQAIIDADLILGIGIRFGEMTTDGYRLIDPPDAAQTIVHVHPSDRELGKVVQAKLPIQSSPNTFVQAMAAATVAVSTHRSAWTGALRAERDAAMEAPTQPGALDMSSVMATLQQRLPGDVVLTNGAGNFAIWPNKHFSFGSDARLLAPQSGSMGYGLPAAIAARIADPSRTVVCFAGDGDLQMNIQELGTAMQHDAQPVVLVLNNAMYGTIRMHQERKHPGRVSGTDIVNPDFVAIAAAYGMHAERISDTDAFPSALDRALESETGALLELMVPPEMLTPSLSILQARTR